MCMKCPKQANVYKEEEDKWGGLTECGEWLFIVTRFYFGMMKMLKNENYGDGCITL